MSQVVNSYMSSPATIGTDASPFYVLVRDDVGLVAVYWAIVGNDFYDAHGRAAVENMVASRGSKLTCRQAHVAFPHLKESEYRA